MHVYVIKSFLICFLLFSFLHNKCIVDWQPSDHCLYITDFSLIPIWDNKKYFLSFEVPLASSFSVP